MNLNQLRIFHAVARLLSFTRASEELHLTQPGISKQIKELEEYYGTLLFERLGKKIVLTQAGGILFETTTDIFKSLSESKARIDDLIGLAAGELVVGAGITIATYILPEMLVGFRQKYPRIDIRVDIGRSRQIVNKVLDNSVELGFVGHYEEDKRLIAKPFISDQMVLIVSSKHKWANRDSSVDLKELADQPFLLSKKGSGTWRIVADLLEKAGIVLKSTMELGTTEGVKQAVEADLGISIVSKHVLPKEPASGLIRSLPLAAGELRRDLFLIGRKDRYLSRAARAFLDIHKLDLNRKTP